MAVNVDSIRAAVAAQIQTVCGINAFPYVTNSTIYPRAEVLPDTPFLEYHGSFGTGMATMNVLVVVRHSAGDLVSVQKRLSDFVGGGQASVNSIIDALEQVATGATHPNLSNATSVSDVMVSDVTLDNGVQVGDGGPYEFTATFKVTIRVSRS